MEEQQLAVEDFEEALSRAGAAEEAASTLASYLTELRGAPEALLLQLAGAFRRHAAAVAAVAPTGAACTSLQPSLDLERLLLQVVSPSPAATWEVQQAWDSAAAALVYGQEGDSPAAAVERLERACSTQLAAQLLSPDRLARLLPPGSHQQARSLCSWLLHLHLFPNALAGVPAGLAECLAAAAAPPWLGRDVRHAQQAQAAAFEAFAGVLQCRAARQRLETLERCDAEAAAAAHAAALRFLLLFRPPLPAAAELWWAHFAALLHGVVGLVQPGPDGAGGGRGGLAGLRRPELRHLIRALCCQDTAHMVVPLVLAHPAYQAEAGGGGSAEGNGGGRRGRKKAGGGGGGEGGGEGAGSAGGAKAAARAKDGLRVAAGLLVHDTPAFLVGCSELLRPEANAPLQARVEALAAMGRAAAAYLADDDDDDLGDEEDGAGKENDSEAAPSPAQRLWQPAALDQLLFVLRSDPSVRVRREALKVLGTAAGLTGIQEAAVVRAAAQRCRDRDEVVRRDAFALLASLLQASLQHHLPLPDWRALLDSGLTAPLAAKPSKHAAAIHGSALLLLRRHLDLAGHGGGSGDGSGRQSSREEAGDGGGDMEVTEGVTAEGEESWEGGAEPAWLEKLRELAPSLPAQGQQAQHGSLGAAEVHRNLQAAWVAALSQVLEPDQLAAIGLDAPEDAVGGWEAGEAAGAAGSGQDADQSVEAGGVVDVQWE